MNPDKPPHILAIASRGGHWVQLLRLNSAFKGATVTYASSQRELASTVPGHRFLHFPDANRDKKTALFLQVLKIMWIVIITRPNIIVSTGASCGFIAAAVGRLFGAKALFVDSIANAEELSLSAKLSIKVANQVLTQWPHLAQSQRIMYKGSVLS